MPTSINESGLHLTVFEYINVKYENQALFERSIFCCKNRLKMK